MDMLAAGKPPYDVDELGQLRFDAEDQVAYARRVVDGDPATASLILTNKVFQLISLYFDLRQAWTPAPKQLLAEIEKLSPRLHDVLLRFYSDCRFGEKARATDEIVSLVFGDHTHQS